MNKTTKGAFAATTAAVLLLGGAGTLAFWTDDAFVDGGDVTSGYLRLDAGTCDTDWVHANGPQVGQAVTTIVPGDVLTKSCTFTIDAEGDNLKASPDVQETVDIESVTRNSGLSGDKSSLSLPVTAAYSLDGAPFTDASFITDANKNDTLTAAIEVSFPFGSNEQGAPIINGNGTQDLFIVLDDITVTLEQVLNTATPAPQP